ncbi:3-oxoacyl-[acyl-carrier-protein] synthase II, chloroplastic-like [Pyrus communis]|uniref:3-oxoacyl-[acyl-carrier-protein] synthase II, chloroplastic-like n=1 Tax=Pyrus communis TaxID=23211 RepID=UPI0035BF3DB2
MAQTLFFPSHKSYREEDRIYIEFLGGSVTGYAYHMTAVHPDSIYFNHLTFASCVKNQGQELLLAQSGVSREDVNYINAYATSTPTGDLKEYRALIRCLRKNPELRVNPTKSMIDHLMGASGAVEAVGTIKVMQTGCIHQNINLENPNKSVQDINVFVRPNKEKLDMEVVLSNSFGQNPSSHIILQDIGQNPLM